MISSIEITQFTTKKIIILFSSNIHSDDNAMNSNTTFNTIVAKSITISFLTIDKTKLYFKKKNANNAIDTNELSKRIFDNHD